ncbi:MAG: 4-(cytidine 5'-diphospho)-2-C-methyl-D-erythritol kinase [Acidobacteriaceae bacterium]
MSVTVRSFCKINLGLAIGPARPDGFHALATCYQALGAHDLVTVEARPAGTTAISLTSTDARVPTDARNTAWKMVERALAAMGVSAEVAIHIEKRLPVQGGLGAGSANAVAALIGLEQELARYGIPALPEAERLRIAAEVGSDVPLFLIGGAVLGTGRGEQVAPLGDLPPTECVLALPGIGVSTPQAFRDWDEKQRAAISDQRSREISASSGREEGFRQTSRSLGLTAPRPSDRLEALSRALSAALGPEACAHSSGVTASRGDLAETVHPLLALVRTGIENDFEEVVFRQYPLLGTIKRILAGSGSPDGALHAALSGSGSALFGLYGSAAAATAAEERLSAAGVRSLRTQTLPRQEYWNSMMER